MMPNYVTAASGNISPWRLVNWHTTPINIGFGILVSGLSSQYTLQVTFDDPTNVYPSSAGPTVFSASAVSAIVTSSMNQAGVITQPIAAWRINNTSTAGVVTATALQAGIG
ncbi:hypothetical protein HL666_14815 [Bradyrhizobium sp. 83002]|uniref:hypothetical protein n=1 Tax=Bradyrhizobium aeschynomenes TaxID=2734909 RepID=UPI0015566E67|nr:hypothetical protein [Bradyrhizobium aeschynomenes]NPU12041.1 hypothetical protein [Bradyrhizobium aeschynomenes]